MNQEFFESLKKWQKAGESRVVKIELGNQFRSDYTYVYIYDGKLTAGAIIDTIEDLDSLDLIGNRRRMLEKALANLPLAA